MSKSRAASWPAPVARFSFISIFYFLVSLKQLGRSRSSQVRRALSCEATCALSSAHRLSRSAGSAQNDSADPSAAAFSRSWTLRSSNTHEKHNASSSPINQPVCRHHCSSFAAPASSAQVCFGCLIKSIGLQGSIDTQWTARRSSLELSSRPNGQSAPNARDHATQPTGRKLIAFLQTQQYLKSDRSRAKEETLLNLPGARSKSNSCARGRVMGGARALDDKLTIRGATLLPLLSCVRTG